MEWLKDKGVAVARLNGKSYEFDPARKVVTALASAPETTKVDMDNAAGMLWVAARRAAKALGLDLHIDDNGRVLYLAVPKSHKTRQ